MERKRWASTGLVALAVAAGVGCSNGTRAVHSDARAVPSGGGVFAQNCAVCHAEPILAYMFPQMRGRPPGFVYDAISVGPMRLVGQHLDEPSRRAVAEFFTGVPFGSAESARSFEISPACAPEHGRFD